jgi:hypothetical protein
MISTIEQEESSDLKEEYIVNADWHDPEVGFVYDISYLHEEWGLLTQTFTIFTMVDDGPVYSSEFLLFRKGETLASNFSNYLREEKKELWKVIFAIKKRFFEEVQPAEVEHFIKQPHSVRKRLPIYQTYLNLPEYDIQTTRQTIKYIKKKLSQ